MARTYELTLVLRSDSDVTDPKKQEALVKKLVGSATKLLGVTHLGKKQLAYEIKKQTEGVYLVAKLEGTVRVGDIENQVKLDGSILRYLLIAA